MATLKDHQQAMVDLLAAGSGIPASASRLAHAMHDVLAYMTQGDAVSPLHTEKRPESTTSGLNDKALAADIEACRPKDTMFDRASAAERRVKELENTVKQLRANNAKLREDISCYRAIEASLTQQVNNLTCIADCDTDNGCWHSDCPKALTPEQAGCRKQDTQVCDHEFNVIDDKCCKCGVAYVTVCGEAKYK